jgi:hypothetical protein
MFETLKLGIIDLQREPDFAIDASKKLVNILIGIATEKNSSESEISEQSLSFVQ